MTVVLNKHYGKGAQPASIFTCLCCKSTENLTDVFQAGSEGKQNPSRKGHLCNKLLLWSFTLGLLDYKDTGRKIISRSLHYQCASTWQLQGSHCAENKPGAALLALKRSLPLRKGVIQLAEGHREALFSTHGQLSFTAWLSHSPFAKDEEKIQ